MTTNEWNDPLNGADDGWDSMAARNLRARIAELEAERDAARAEAASEKVLHDKTIAQRDAAEKALYSARAGEARAVEALKRIREDLETIAAGKEEEVRNDFSSGESHGWGSAYLHVCGIIGNAATQPALDWLAQREREAAAEVWKTAIMLACGCHDYGGGHFGEKYQAFQHGIDTVISVLEAKRDGDDSLQIKVVEHVGAAALRARKEVGE